MSDRKAISLPEAEDMTKRLEALNVDVHLREGFHPLLFEHAGRKLYYEGIVLVIATATYTYCIRMTQAREWLIIQLVIGEYVDALVDDKEVAEQVKQGIHEILASRKAVLPTPSKY